MEATTTDDAVLVCTADDALRYRIRSALQREWPVRTASTCREAVASLSEHVSVIVLDRGDRPFSFDRLRRRQESRDLVAEVLAMVERGRGTTDEWVDASLYKPVEEAELRAAVERLQRRVRYDRLLGHYYDVAEDYASLASRVGGTDPVEIAHHRERLADLRRELDDLAGELDDGDAFDVATEPFEDDFDADWGDLDL